MVVLWCLRNFMGGENVSVFLLVCDFAIDVGGSGDRDEKELPR